MSVLNESVAYQLSMCLLSVARVASCSLSESVYEKIFRDEDTTGSKSYLAIASNSRKPFYVEEMDEHFC
ncbi:hypothetical protein JTE90_016859 [Oedothorax gibbosus]|uniref:Secreted protein n=1 Tax=Oedothorax gibbosus TaxID=931172 RepID=A0AAV6W0U7_9ARAC|nr:hypothetical protein JTE90_016859 [Oedothorax gibbosus]